MLSSVTIAVLTAATAFADSPQSAAAPPSGTTASDSSGLQEIVVTATKRETTVLNTPASITAISGAQLGAAGGIQNLSDMAADVPNMSVGNQFGVNRTFIRGIGLTSIDLGADGAVAFLQDGAQIARPAEQLSGFYDLQRVDVLQGPQGTLYGRSATAGVVNMITNKPTDSLDGYADLTFGNYSNKTFEGAIGGPINDVLSARIATKIVKHDGYGTNLYTGTQIDDQDSQAVRGIVRYKPSDKLVADFEMDYIHEDDNDYAFHYFGTTPTTVGGVLTPTPNSSLPAVALFGGQTIFSCCGANPNLRDIYSSIDPTNKRHGIGGSISVDWKPDNFDFKSVTSFRNFSRFNADDLLVSNITAYGRNNYVEDSQSYTQDFTVTTSAFGIDWIGGLDYFHERLFGSVIVPTIGLAVTATGGDCTPRNPAGPIPCDLFDSGLYAQIGTVTTSSYAGFIEGSYNITDALKATAGVRYTHEERSGTGSFVFNAEGIDTPTDESASWNAATPKFLLEYHLDPDTMIYASINRGFKSGVINVGSENPVIAPEYVWAYETGLKLKAFENRLQYTSAIFYYDYTNLQVGFVNAQSIVETINAASARNYGWENTLELQITPHFQVNAAATYLSAKYTNFTNGNYRDGFAPEQLSGNYLDNAPPYTARIGFDYTIPLAGDAGKILLHGEDAYQGKVYFTEFNNSDAEQGGYGLINATGGWQSSDEHWKVTGWVRNAANKFALANDIISAPLYDNVRVGTLMPPRTYGITLGYKF